jgi:hypothetical protein
MILTHKFVNQVPEKLEEGVIYVSIPFETVIHMCCCGCGKEVVTPLSPTGWSLTFDGETITLDPSIGNWNFQCRSHYFIRKNKVIWARQYTKLEIEENRYRDFKNRVEFYSDSNSSQTHPPKKGIKSEQKVAKPLEKSSKFKIWFEKQLNRFRK